MSTISTSGGPDVAQHRDYLYRFALLHLRDASRADDVVQETLLAAVESPERFSGRSSLRTWLTGILKHKIIDVFRKQAREQTVDSLAGAESDEEFADLHFNAQDTDHWHSFPTSWATRSARSKTSGSGRYSISAASRCRRRWRACSTCAN